MATKHFDRKGARVKRHRRVRVHVAGTPERPRLAIYRSLNHIYAQVIDDATGRTLASASTLALKSGSSNAGAAVAVGKAIAEQASKAGIKQVVFDRGGFLYHGRVAAVAEAAREAGMEL